MSSISTNSLATRGRTLWLGLVEWVRAHPWRAVALAPALLAGLILLYVLVLIPFTPSIVDIRKARTEQPAVLMSVDGKELAVFRRANRTWVKLGDIAPETIAALIATEDHRFYEHHGLDLRRTVAAVLYTLSGDRQGGSTITQQLARNLYPEEIGRAVSVTRKIKEAITALKIEAIYTKPEILEAYLNTVPFLYNAWGIEMAAQTYFDKPARQLDVLESATLVGMLKGASYYNPVTNPDRARQRRNVVLAQMARHGKIDAQRLALLQKRPLKIDFERQTEATGPAPHVARLLRRWLIDWADRHGYDIHADGLIVRTTIDSRLQAQATQAMARQIRVLQGSANTQWGPRAGFAPTRPVVKAMVRESAAYKAAVESGLDDAQALKRVVADAAFMQALREEKTRLSAGLMAMDPRNGQVRAWVGSPDFAKDQFDHVQQARRQPGSTFKPFVYGAAFAQGIRPSAAFVDQPVEIAAGGGQVWRPTDGGEPSYQAMTLRQGLAQSKNTITAQLMAQVGPQAVARLARAMGVRQSRLDEVLSLGLGTSPVTLREMVSAYATLANGGSYIEPTLVLRIEDSRGKVLESFAPLPPESALPRDAADMLLDVLRSAIDEGTGSAIRWRYGIQADVAGKTGTTQDNTDGWFILMHPELVAGAWVGFNDARIVMGDSYGSGARSALPMVGDFFQSALRQRVIGSDTRFEAPRGAGMGAVAEPVFAPGGPGGSGGSAGTPGGWQPGFGTAAPAEATQ